MVFARDSRTLYFRSGSGLYAAPIPASATAGAGGQSAGAAGGGRGGEGRGGGAAPTATEQATTNATARQVTYTANIEIDRKALRAQVFNEGWRIMKNRFYDGEMHGADWPAMKKMYEPLLEYLVDDEELHTIMMMMIGQLNASHTGVSGGAAASQRTLLTRYPGFDVVADTSGFYRVGHIYKDVPPIGITSRSRKGITSSRWTTTI